MKKRLKPWHIGTHLRVLGQGYPMNTNMAEFRRFRKICTFVCDESSLSIGRVMQANRLDLSIHGYRI